MIGSEDNANYRPVVARWTGSSFSTPKLIGENQSCPALTFDLVTDGSGRLANVSERCGKLGVYNLPDTKNAAIVRFALGRHHRGRTADHHDDPRLRLGGLGHPQPDPGQQACPPGAAAGADEDEVGAGEGQQGDRQRSRRPACRS